jgi:trk system potassium uptake protein TrkH
LIRSLFEAEKTLRRKKDFTIHHGFVIYTIGRFLIVLALILIVPCAIAFFEVKDRPFPQLLLDERIIGFIIAIVLSVLCGGTFLATGEKQFRGSGVREGFAIVTFGWLIFTLLGSLPLFFYFLSNTDSRSAGHLFRCFTDANFEIMSGYTTTGATILEEIETLPRGILFWRSLTHWLGGMGIVTLAMSIFPAYGVAAYQMFRGEVPGPETERLKPRLAQTAKVLWGVYAFLTLLEAAMLMAGRMSLFDSLCHAFGTMATGGFSTKNGSIGFYNSSYIDAVVCFFMFLAGINFIVHYNVIFARNFGSVKKNSELHFYTAVILTAILITTIMLSVNGLATKDQARRSYRYEPLTETEMAEEFEKEQSKLDSWHGSLRFAAFQVISLTTTTGYTTADFDIWPAFLRLMVVILMFFGGCAGSTGGGLKMVRVLVVSKTILREIKTMIQPRLVAPIKIGGEAIEEKQVRNILSFVMLYILIFILLSVVMSMMIPDVTTAVSSVVSTMCNIGPGLSGIGAVENYAWIPIAGKWVLFLCMLLGRLEVYTVLIALSPVWRKKL